MIDIRRAPRPEEGQTRLLAEPNAEFAPSTYDPEAGTVDVVWSTGAEVRRRDWWTGAIYTESLDMKGARTDRLNQGAPLLLDHWASVRNMVGSVVPDSAKVENGKGVATLRFDRSSADGQAAEAKVAAGHVRFVSIGYSINGTDLTRGKGTLDDPDKVRITDFEPYEISLVAVPADAGAGLRSLPAAPTTPASTTTEEGRMADRTTPGSEPENTNPQTPPAGQRTPEPTGPKAATMVEINAVAKRAGQDLDWAISMEGKTLDEVRDLAIDAVAATRRPIEQTRTPSGDDPALVREAMADAIAIRYQPGFKPGNDMHAKFRGWRPSDMVTALLEARGERNIPRDRQALAERAFHTTSDFPLLLSAAANKMLLAGYQLAQPTYRRIAARKAFNDFKAHNFLRAGDFPTLLPLAEASEIKFGTLSEGKETAYLTTYARRIRFTRQLIVNDDLGALGDWGTMIGQRIPDFENTTFFTYALQNSYDGPAMADTVNMFSTAATRLNKASSGTTIDVTALGLGRAAMMKQTSLDGLKLNITPSILLTGPDQLTLAEQVTATVQPVINSAVNPFSGRLTPVADANITGDDWWLFADPAVLPNFIYGYLDGSEAPQVSSGPVQGFDGFELQVILDFGVGAIDFRGGYRNAGAT